ncbi:MAG: U32 family peptidase [Clostridia bacterium]|nr:U32 family peptidase [Clostridia bacterium]
MRRKSELPELLAPAGDFECLLAAVEGGADAVYVGGKAFGARAYAKNFELDELRRAVIYCHLHSVKLYVTVNTLVFDREMRELSDYAAALWEIGVDALIVSDLGVIREIRRRLPDLELHASTQMSVHSSDGAKIAAELGCSRVVLARELSYENIVAATEASPIETEVFLHGALCVCHSGQCLFSSLVGGRSGNRGECAQPCRLPYGEGYPLSLSDLSLAEHIEKLIDAGVASLKIEGRMKSPEYVYTVTSIYRRLLDERRSAKDEEKSILKAAFSRGGFTDGYFTSHTFSKMTGVRSEEDKNDTKELGERVFTPRCVKITASSKILRGVPSELTLTLGEKSVTVTGEVPSEAISAPLTEAAVKERLSKLGGTYLTLDERDISITLDEGLNLPPSAINALRREAVIALTSAARAPVSREYIPDKFKTEEKNLNTALFLCSDLLTKVYNDALGSFDVVFAPLFDYRRLKDRANGVYIPPIVTDSERSRVKEALLSAVNLGAKYALIGNIEHLPLIEGLKVEPIGDFRLNIANSEARAAYRELGVKTALLSAELTLPMARDVGGGAIVYGRIPLMLTERCFMKENFGCNSCSACSLTDRKGAQFPIIREFEHRNLILNSAVTYMGDKSGELDEAGIRHRHSIFSVESEGEVHSAIEAMKNGSPLPSFVTVRRMGKREAQKQKDEKRGQSQKKAKGQKAQNGAPVLKNSAKSTAKSKRKFNR